MHPFPEAVTPGWRGRMGNLDHSPPVVLVAKAVILDTADRVLLVRHNHGTRQWDLPAGHAEPREGPQQACAGELLEETGLHISAGPIVGLN